MQWSSDRATIEAIGMGRSYLINLLFCSLQPIWRSDVAKSNLPGAYMYLYARHIV